MKYFTAGAITLLCSIVLLISACDNTNYEIQTAIEPEVLNINDKKETVSIKYNLGPVPVIDDLEDLKDSHIVWIDNTKNNLKLNLLVRYSDQNGSSINGFHYYYGSTKLCRTQPVDLDHLCRFSEDIPGFKWFIRDGDTIGDLQDAVDLDKPTFQGETKELQNENKEAEEPKIQSPPVKKELEKVL